MATGAEGLSDGDKRTLEAQERYRVQVRGQLQQEKDAAASRENPLWKFLNSSFALWLFSAVFVTWAGSAYTERENDLKARQAQKEADAAQAQRTIDLIDRLDLEISYRLSMSMARLRAIDGRFTKPASPESIVAVRSALLPLTGPATDTTPLFPEFSAYSGLALIADLRRRLPEGEDLKGNVVGSLGYVIAKVSGLAEDLSAGPRDAKQTASELISIMGGPKDPRKKPRWDRSFYYTDCTAEKPFC